MVGTLILIFIFLTLILLIARPDLGLCLYLIIYFLVPSLELSVIGLEATETSVVFALFFMLANIRNIKYFKKIDFSPLIPFFVLYTVLFSLTFFSSQVVPLGFSIKNLVRYIIQTFIIPVCIYMMIICMPPLLKKVNTTMLLVISVVVVYGLLLTLVPGTNPYLEVISKEGINLPEIHLGSDEGRLFGAISSVFMHPMSFGIMLGFSFCYIVYIRKQKGINHVVFWGLALMILMCILFSGVRTSLAALMGTGVVYLLKRKKIKLLVEAVVVVGLLMLLVSYIPRLDAYVNSMFQLESDYVEGSSINQRLEQLTASLWEIRNNPSFGNGYAWHSYYIWQNGGYGHPLLHGWESLVFVALTDSGYAGVLVWVAFVVFFFIKYKDIGITCLFTYFMLYRIITGTFGENFFYIFYVLFLCVQGRRRTLLPSNITT